MKQRKLIIIISIIIGAILIGLLIYQIPIVKSTVDWRYDQFKTRVYYYFNPPEDVSFTPQEQDVMITATPSSTPSPTNVLPEGTDLPPTETPTPTPDINALPESVILEDVVYIDQHERWDYCAPANLTMALKYWGWTGNRDQIAYAIKPGVDDPDADIVKQSKSDPNVRPYEMASYVINETEYSAVLRFGGDVDLLKNLIANGFPVVIELGFYDHSAFTGKYSWIGHFLFVTGYDDAEGVFIVQDSYLIPGESLRVPYDELYNKWRSFNFVFFVIFPLDQQEALYTSLGNYLDPVPDNPWSARHALEVAKQDAEDLYGVDEFFAWYNIGTSHVKLNEYYDAAIAYDQAFALYEELDESINPSPYRIIWYQTGPYWAYYYSNQYNAIISLATSTLETHSKAAFEESYYWRGLAYDAIGQTENAIADFLEAVRLNPNYISPQQQLDRLGVDN
jgi:tetratricopeptide (TPR) repeat protein